MLEVGKTEIDWSSTHGIDIQAKRDLEKWIIEVKGSQPSNPLYINYFLSVLGEILQRMDDPVCKYSIALPDIEQFHRLWERLPLLAREGLYHSIVCEPGRCCNRNKLTASAFLVISI